MSKQIVNEIINKGLYIEYKGLCANMIEQEMIRPLKMDLTIERKRMDYEEFEFERKITEFLEPSRLERRTTFDSKHYYPVYSED